MRRLAWVVGDGSPTDLAHREAWSDALQRAGWQFVDRVADADAVLAWTSAALPLDDQTLSERASRPLLLVGPTVTASSALHELSGLMVRDWTPPHPARLRAEGLEAWVERVAPTGQELEVTTSVPLVEKVRDCVDVWVSAPVGLARQPVVAHNTETGVITFAAHLGSRGSRQDVDALARLLHLTLRRVLGVDQDEAPRPLRVGLLGYGAIGAEHARAADQLPGLELAMVCDRNADRLAQARATSHGLATTTDARQLIRGDVDLVVVSTPPDTHADWAVEVLEAGRHVVVEKPLAITTAEADAVLTAAAASGRRAVTYQNRRFDPDFLAVRAEIARGRIGEVFHTETFIGGYGHPCNYWHSDAEVSGGAVYDWGSHVIDQLLALADGPIAHVTCTEHKRRWHDVTNADHTSMLIRFQDGSEATFVHSDLAAALKPRWYVLGTEGALVSEWRATSVLSRNEVGTLAEDRLAVTDAPPELYRMGPDGSRTSLTLPAVAPHRFHRELVDDLTYGWPMSVTAAQSRRVVAVMEAARESAHLSGTPVPVDGES